MFDSPGVAPFCIAPVIGALVGVLVWSLARRMSPVKPPDGYPLGIFAGVLAGIVATGIACFGLAFLFDALAQPGSWFEPSSGDLAGAYQLDTIGAQVTFPDHSLVLSADGTFQAAHLPDFWAMPAGWNISSPLYMSDMTYLDGSGVWHIRNDRAVSGDTWLVVADFHRVNGRPDTRSMRFAILGHLSPYVLGYTSEPGGFFRFARSDK